MTNVAAASRIDSIIARQRSSRLRDAVFAAALAVGAMLSLGALHAAAESAAAPVAAASAHTVDAG